MSHTFTPPLQTGLHLTTRDDQFVIAVSLKNPTDDPITFTTPSSTLFTVSLEGNHSKMLWQHSQMATQAYCSWELAPNTRITSQYEVPNIAVATERAEERIEQREDFWDRNPDLVGSRPSTIKIETSPLNIDLRNMNASREEQTEQGDDEADTWVVYETAVDPDEVGIVNAVAGLPKTGGVGHRLTRQYDLREPRSERELDASLPDATMDGLEKLR